MSSWPCSQEQRSGALEAPGGFPMRGVYLSWLRACGLGPLAHAELFLEHSLGACGSQRAGMSFTGCTLLPQVLVVSRPGEIEVPAYG